MPRRTGGTQEGALEIDHDGMRERMEAIRLKQLLGEPLSDRELMCLQIEQHGLGRRPAVPPARDSEPPR